MTLPESDAASPSVRALLRQLGLKARKGLSQSFLLDEGVCRTMAEAAALSSSDDVLEIGPGLGILTRVLVQRARRVVAVELDRQLATSLPSLVPANNLRIVSADALQVDPAQLGLDSYKLVANLPYQITSPVLTRFLVEVALPTVLVLMVQREVAERVVAADGQASYLSILVQSVAEARIVRRVPAGAFYPRPRVDSAVLRLSPYASRLVPRERLEPFLKLARAGFTQPRKTVANSLAQGLAVPRIEVEASLRAAGLEPGMRPHQLTLQDWLRLLDASASEDI
jgi:16S rRNA (adenine1518-N6/adenine1519-N6)-dimethyltransferase